MRQPTVDDVINGYFESLMPSPEEVQAMVSAWPVQITETPNEAEKDFQSQWVLDLAAFYLSSPAPEDTTGLEIIERALDEFLTRTDPEDD